jgi:hypothetical protein
MYHFNVPARLCRCVRSTIFKYLGGFAHFMSVFENEHCRVTISTFRCKNFVKRTPEYQTSTIFGSIY